MIRGDVGQMTWTIRDNVTDLCDIWLQQPWNRKLFGEQELRDLRASHLKLSLLLSAVDAKDKEVA